jgi:hypothetical protein
VRHVRASRVSVKERRLLVTQLLRRRSLVEAAGVPELLLIRRPGLAEVARRSSSGGQEGARN